MLDKLKKKKLLESLKQEETSEGEQIRKEIDKDYWTEEVVIKGDPLGPTSLRSVDDEEEELKKKKKK